MRIKILDVPNLAQSLSHSQFSINSGYWGLELRKNFFFFFKVGRGERVFKYCWKRVNRIEERKYPKERTGDS